MKPTDANDERGERTALVRGVRFDLLIAVSALAMSTLTTAASWWQTRVIQQQLAAQQQQLSAQVWPYVGVAETLNNDTIRFNLENKGLGPAVLRSATVTVDGKSQPNFVAVIHAILGPHVLGREPRGERVFLGVSSISPGDVLRVGESSTLLTFTSKHFAEPFVRAHGRIGTRICYCAIVPATCWVQETGRPDPEPVRICRDIPKDLLHGSPDAALDRTF